MNTSGSIFSEEHSLPVMLRLPVNWLAKKLDEAGVSHVKLRLADSQEINIGEIREPVPVPVIKLNHPARALLSARNGVIGFAEAYMAGDWDTPDVQAVTDWAMANEGCLSSLFSPGWLNGRLQRLLHVLNNNTRKGSRRNIAAHYDLGNDFYRHWLDDSMTYSSALYQDESETLEQAQQNKYGQVLDWLKPEPDHTVLEIGCGWGGFSRALSARAGSQYHGVTLSQEQLAYARSFQDRDELQNCEYSLTDYRDITGQFDRIASIEMIEAVGEQHWPAYFNTIRERLKPGGQAVLQVITIAEERFDRYRNGADFIQRYIFPGGMLPTHTVMLEQVKNAGLTMVDTLAFGKDYARTLSIWAEQFNRKWPEIRDLGFDERFRRMWNFYLAYCEAGFNCGSIDVRFYKLSRVWSETGK